MIRRRFFHRIRFFASFFCSMLHMYRLSIPSFKGQPILCFSFGVPCKFNNIYYNSAVR